MNEATDLDLSQMLRLAKLLNGVEGYTVKSYNRKES